MFAERAWLEEVFWSGDGQVADPDDDVLIGCENVGPWSLVTCRDARVVLTGLPVAAHSMCSAGSCAGYGPAGGRVLRSTGTTIDACTAPLG